MDAISRDILAYPNSQEQQLIAHEVSALGRRDSKVSYDALESRGNGRDRVVGQKQIEVGREEH